MGVKITIPGHQKLRADHFLIVANSGASKAAPPQSQVTMVRSDKVPDTVAYELYMWSAVVLVRSFIEQHLPEHQTEAARIIRHAIMNELVRWKIEGELERDAPPPVKEIPPHPKGSIVLTDEGGVDG